MLFLKIEKLILSLIWVSRSTIEYGFLSSLFSFIFFSSIFLYFFPFYFICLSRYCCGYFVCKTCDYKHKSFTFAKKCVFVCLCSPLPLLCGELESMKKTEFKMLYFYKCTKIRSISIKHIFLFVTQNEQNRRENVKIKLIFIPYMPSMMFRVFLRTLTIRIFCVKSIFGVSRFFVALARLGCGELLFFSMCVHPTFVLM